MIEIKYVTDVSFNINKSGELNFKIRFYKNDFNEFIISKSIFNKINALKSINNTLNIFAIILDNYFIKITNGNITYNLKECLIQKQTKQTDSEYIYFNLVAFKLEKENNQSWYTIFDLGNIYSKFSIDNDFYNNGNILNNKKSYKEIKYYSNIILPTSAEKSVLLKSIFNLLRKKYLLPLANRKFSDNNSSFVFFPLIKPLPNIVIETKPKNSNSEFLIFNNFSNIEISKIDGDEFDTVFKNKGLVISLKPLRITEIEGEILSMKIVTEGDTNSELYSIEYDDINNELDTRINIISFNFVNNYSRKFFNQKTGTKIQENNKIIINSNTNKNIVKNANIVKPDIFRKFDDFIAKMVENDTTTNYNHGHFTVSSDVITNLTRPFFSGNCRVLTSDDTQETSEVINLSINKNDPDKSIDISFNTYDISSNYPLGTWEWDVNEGGLISDDNLWIDMSSNDIKFNIYDSIEKYKNEDVSGTVEFQLKIDTTYIYGYDLSYQKIYYNGINGEDNYLKPNILGINKEIFEEFNLEDANISFLFQNDFNFNIDLFVRNTYNNDFSGNLFSTDTITQEQSVFNLKAKSLFEDVYGISNNILEIYPKVLDGDLLSLIGTQGSISVKTQSNNQLLSNIIIDDIIVNITGMTNNNTLLININEENFKLSNNNIRFNNINDKFFHRLEFRPIPNLSVNTSISEILYYKVRTNKISYGTEGTPYNFIFERESFFDKSINENNMEEVIIATAVDERFENNNPKRNTQIYNYRTTTKADAVDIEFTTTENNVYYFDMSHESNKGSRLRFFSNRECTKELLKNYGHPMTADFNYNTILSDDFETLAEYSKNIDPGFPGAYVKIQIPTVERIQGLNVNTFIKDGVRESQIYYKNKFKQNKNLENVKVGIIKVLPRNDINLKRLTISDLNQTNTGLLNYNTANYNIFSTLYKEDITWNTMTFNVDGSFISNIQHDISYNYNNNGTKDGVVSVYNKGQWYDKQNFISAKEDFTLFPDKITKIIFNHELQNAILNISFIDSENINTDGKYINPVFMEKVFFFSTEHGTGNATFSQNPLVSKLTKIEFHPVSGSDYHSTLGDLLWESTSSYDSLDICRNFITAENPFVGYKFVGSGSIPPFELGTYDISGETNIIESKLYINYGSDNIDAGEDNAIRVLNFYTERGRDISYNNLLDSYGAQGFRDISFGYLDNTFRYNYFAILENSDGSGNKSSYFKKYENDYSGNIYLVCAVINQKLNFCQLKLKGQHNFDERKNHEPQYKIIFELIEGTARRTKDIVSSSINQMSSQDIINIYNEYEESGVITVEPIEMVDLSGADNLICKEVVINKIYDPLVNDYNISGINRFDNINQNSSFNIVFEKDKISYGFGNNNLISNNKNFLNSDYDTIGYTNYSKKILLVIDENGKIYFGDNEDSFIYLVSNFNVPTYFKPIFSLQDISGNDNEKFNYYDLDLINTTELDISSILIRNIGGLRGFESEELNGENIPMSEYKYDVSNASIFNITSLKDGSRYFTSEKVFDKNTGRYIGLSGEDPSYNDLSNNYYDISGITGNNYTSNTSITQKIFYDNDKEYDISGAKHGYWFSIELKKNEFLDEITITGTSDLKSNPKSFYVYGSNCVDSSTSEFQDPSLNNQWDILNRFTYIENFYNYEINENEYNFENNYTIHRTLFVNKIGKLSESEAVAYKFYRILITDNFGSEVIKLRQIKCYNKKVVMKNFLRENMSYTTRYLNSNGLRTSQDSAKMFDKIYSSKPFISDHTLEYDRLNYQAEENKTFPDFSLYDLSGHYIGINQDEKNYLSKKKDLIGSEYYKSDEINKENLFSKTYYTMGGYNSNGELLNSAGETIDDFEDVSGIYFTFEVNDENDILQSISIRGLTSSVRDSETNILIRDENANIRELYIFGKIYTNVQNNDSLTSEDINEETTFSYPEKYSDYFWHYITKIEYTLEEHKSIQDNESFIKKWIKNTYNYNKFFKFYRIVITKNFGAPYIYIDNIRLERAKNIIDKRERSLVIKDISYNIVEHKLNTTLTNTGFFNITPNVREITMNENTNKEEYNSYRPFNDIVMNDIVVQLCDISNCIFNNNNIHIFGTKTALLEWEFNSDNIYVDINFNVYRMQNSTDASITGRKILIGTTKNKYFYDENAIPYLIANYYIEPTIEWRGEIIKLEQVSASKLICKNNKFPYGRYNVRQDNPKLFSYTNGNILQDPNFNNNNVKTGSHCSKNNMTNNPRSTILFKNTNVMSQKELYTMLSKGMRRPFR